MCDSNDRKMRLSDVEWIILEHLRDGKRDVAPNIADASSEYDESPEDGFKRSYINTRTPKLRDLQLIERVGVENSGLYVITEKGKLAVDNREKYDEIDADDDRPIIEFYQFLEQQLEERTEEE